jgi:host factor-I protein
MPSKGRQRLQEVFLSQLIKSRTPVTVSLLNGVKLQGTISSFDDFCISLLRDTELQAIYKQEISTISTTAPIRLEEGWDEAPASARVPMRAPVKPAAKAVVVERKRRFRSPG